MAELSKLGRYQLRRVLGKGAMGVVYDGYDPTISRRVAVKIILKNHAIDEETARAYSARFVREAQAAGRINHPNIVQVYDFGEQEDIAYLVMEFVEGRELRSFFSAKEQFEIKESVRIMGELLDALDFAHEAGVIHRDVKPANVMLDAQRRVKLADFGVARIQDSERSAADTMVGTPAYMSPEQISGKKIDRRTDIFSAGSILYQLLTGEQPFRGDGAWTVAKQIMQDDPPLPSSVTVSVSPAFDGIVNKALAKEPAQRYGSAREFAAALKGALAGDPPLPVPAKVKPVAQAGPSATDTELEYWRSIQQSNDPEELELYLREFPGGAYAQLARHKIAKLRNLPAEDAQVKLRMTAEEKARLEIEEQGKRRAAEERARQEAEAKATREAKERAKSEALEKAQRDAEEKVRREAVEKAKRDAEDKAKREAVEKARREAVEKTKRDADDKTRREAAEKAKREAEAKVSQTQALARLKQQEELAARAKAAVDEDATVASGSRRPEAPSPQPPAERKTSYALPTAAAVVVIAVGIGAYLFLRNPAPPPVAQSPAPPPRAEISKVENEKVRKETEERTRREHADKVAAEQAAAKAAAEKVVQEKQMAMKAAAEKMAAAKTVAEKAVQEKQLAMKAAAEKVAAEKVAAEKVAAEKAAAEKAAVEKAAAERAAAERAAADKTAAEKAAAEKAAAAKAAATKTTAVTSAPSAPGASVVSNETLLKQATALESEGKMTDAIRLYVQAARAGSGPAAKRLGDIYYNGAPGVSPDYGESVKWHNLARRRGVEVGPAGR